MASGTSIKIAKDKSVAGEQLDLFTSPELDHPKLNAEKELGFSLNPYLRLITPPVNKVRRRRDLRLQAFPGSYI